MKLRNHLAAFFDKAASDARIGTSHISLYLAIVSLWQSQGGQKPVALFARQIMNPAKISSSATYVKLLRDLCDGGYLSFEPSFYKRQPSKVHVKELTTHKIQRSHEH